MIPAATPINVPARTLDRWWVSSFSLERDPDSGALTVSYVACLGDLDGFVTSSKNRLPFQRIEDIKQNFAGDDTTLKNIEMLLAAVEAIAQADLQARNVAVLDAKTITPVAVVDPAVVLESVSAAKPMA